MEVFQEHFYRAVGIGVFWSAGIILMLFLFYNVIKLIIEAIASRTKFLWRFIEYLWYYEEFKEFVKDKKDRHPRAK